MDDRDEDEKRRVMTPPKEWSGDQDDKEADSDWLSDAAPQAHAHEDPSAPAKPEVDDAGWLTADDAPPEPDFPSPADAEPEADWFSDDDLSAAPDTTAPVSPPPQSDPTTFQRPDESRTGPAPAKDTAPRVEFSSEDLLTDHQIVGTGTAGRLPLWPTLGGAVAVVLLVIGGWGAISERAALQQRIVELEQQQALPRSLGDLDTEAEAALAAENQALQVQLSSLRGQYSVANSTIDALQSELDQSTRLAEPTTPVPAASTVGTSEALANTDSKAADVAKSEPPIASGSNNNPPPKNSSADGWFVNVAAYSKSATAENWAEKLQGEGYNAVTQTVASGGRTLFRVRAVGFTTQAAAQDAAAQLEDEYAIGPLWVGQQNSGPTPAPARSATEPAAAAEAPAQAEVIPPAAPAPSASTASGGWFIYVDTYAQGLEADKKAQQIEDAGYAAKVAVEYRSNELFYRVQIVGVESREQGESIIETLAAAGDMPNLQLRQY